MPESLVIKISADVNAAKKGIQEVSLTLKEQKAVLASLQKQYAALSTEQARGTIGKELTADIKVAQQEIKRLGTTATSSFGVVGSSASKAFSSLRNLAYLLPGVGIAGIASFAASAIAGLFNVGQEASETAKKLKELIRPLSDIGSSVVGGVTEEIVKIHALTKIITDQTQSYERRNRALQEAKIINQSHFGDLTVETATLGELTKRVREYTEALLQAGLIKAFADELGKVNLELFKQRKSYTDLSKGVDELRGRVKGAGSISNQVFKETNKDLIAQSGIIAQLEQQYGDLFSALQQAVSKSLDLKPLKELKVPKIKIIPEILEFDKSRFKLTHVNIEVPKAVISILDPEFDIRGAAPALSRALHKTKTPTEIAQEFIDEFNKQNQRLTSAAQSAGQGIAEAFGEGFASLVTGEGLKGFFKDMLGAIGSALKQIGAAIIAVSPLIKALKIALATLSPSGILLAGIGLIAAGAIIQKLSARAAGGPVSKGGSYVVGERGPEIFTPSTSGRIIPNHQVSGAGISGGSGELVGKLYADGQQLVALVSVVNKSNGRNF